MTVVGTTSIATVSLSGTLREKLQAVAAAGFDAVELFENDLLTFDGTATDVRELAADLGLQILAFQPFRDFEGMPDPQRERVFDRAERKFDLMQELGTKLLLVCSNVSPASQPGLDRAATDLHELAEKAATRGIRVGFEALSWGRHINDYRDAWEVVRRANHPFLGTILDSFHILASGHDPSAIANIPPEKIFLVQIADAPQMRMDVLPWSRHFRCFPGQGSLALGRFMEFLNHANYRGALSLEVFNDQFRSGSPAQIALDGRRSLTYLSELTLITSQQMQSTREARTSSPPPPPRYGGVEFLEFAVNEESASRLEKWLAALGFRRWGRHRSKDVQVWRQGEVNLVINSEAEGFAHSYNLVHGPSVCALGLRVDDAHRALQRAQAYRCPSFQQSIGPGEMRIPSIHGLEDSLIFFVDNGDPRGTIWEVDFELENLPDSLPTDLQRIDHMSQIVPYGKLLSWVLFYRAVFGFEAGAELDVPDPGGLIHSRVMESQNKLVRLVLNDSQSQGTVAGRFVSNYLGGGLQQIALSTKDIFAKLEKLRANDVPMLAIPHNYYDDLAARFDLDDDLLHRLKEFNILYDRSEEGEFFHAYTHNFAGRVFFELLERRGYQGFGEINAPIRLAAQQRLAANSDSGGDATAQITVR